MEAQGYSTESYEEWKENDMRTELFSESLEEMMEKKAMLEVLKEALDSLMPGERELAEKVFGEEMSVCEYARQKGENRRTLALHKNKVLDKLRDFFVQHGFVFNGKRFDRIVTSVDAFLRKFYILLPTFKKVSLRQ